MKAKLSMLLAAMLMLLMLGMPAMAEEGSPVTTCEAVLREAADGMSAIVGTVPAGTPLEVMEVTGDWALVNAAGQTGYIYRDSVQGISFEAPAQAMRVTIFTSRTTVMNPGETIYLTSILEGFEGYSVSYQWYCDTGSGMMPVGGATAVSWQFEASVESLSWMWQLLVRATPN